MLFSVTTANGLPIYRQIIEQVKAGISNGLLKPGDKLPSHRELATQLVVAPLTVKKAYDILESEQLIYTDRGRGTFVSVETPRLLPDVRSERLRERAKTLLVEAYLLKAPLREVIEILRDERRKIQKQTHDDRENK